MMKRINRKISYKRKVKATSNCKENNEVNYPRSNVALATQKFPEKLKRKVKKGGK